MLRAITITVAVLLSTPIYTQTLAHVRSSKTIRCGIDTEEPEYSTSDDHGNREAFDRDLCRAVAVAILGPNASTTITEYPDDRAAIAALTNHDIDLIPTLSDDFTHSANTHLQFSQPILWDGVGFLLPTGSTITTARQLSGKKICYLSATTVEDSLRAWFARQHLNFVAFPFTEEGEMQAAFSTNNCAALAGDLTRLAQTQSLFAQHGRPTRLLPDLISKDPLAAAVRDGDAQWSSIVSWVLNALIAAEEHNITQSNVAAIRAHAAQPDSTDAAVRFLLGGSHEIGTRLGLSNDWVVNVITATGNYGEIYQRDLGAASAIHLPRGINNLLEHGGAITSLPTK